MTNKRVTRDSDGATIDLAQEEAEHADTTANAKRIVLVDATGTIIGAANPLPVDTELTLSGITIDNMNIQDISEGTQTNDIKIGYVKPDGTNTMPSLDTVGRAGFMKITDGTNTVSIDSDNHLKVTESHSGLSISQGDVTGTTFIHKFGNAPDFDIVDGFVTIWDGADDGGIDEMQYTYSTTAAIDSLSSSNNGDTQDIEVQGLDSNYDLVTQTITLAGQTRVALTTDLIRVFRLINRGSTDLAGDVYCFENTADTTPADGIPDDTTKIRAIIKNGNNQTLMAVYTIPNGKTGYMRSFFAATAGARKTSVHEIRLFARPFGEVFQLKHKTSLLAVGTSNFQYEYVEPAVFAAKTDIFIDTNTDTDISSVAGGFDIVLIDD